MEEIAEMRKNSKNLEPGRRALAREFRRQMGVSERVFWEWVRKDRLGFAFRRQVPIDFFILDFYCAEAAVCVEVDGELHEQRADRDQLRDERLRELGIETYRIPSLILFERTSAHIEPMMSGLVSLLEQRSERKATDIPRMDAKKRLKRYRL